ncbi:MAG: ATP-dependent DNA helicase RecG [Cellvibrionales bacterium TMED148]|nr:ATP-dependent DNA helicase RecG [Porticoccaceae bacterium]RPG92616.1 MAG: ATP-dependent DNA helicase RecG [Cellvibrionales bacterium TMED148]
MLQKPGRQTQIADLRGVGPKLEKKLFKLGIREVLDLIFHLPIRYLDKTKITPIGALQPRTHAQIEGDIRGCDVLFGRRRSLICRIQDQTGTTTLRFFHFNQTQRERLRSGVRLRCFGEVRAGSTGLELYHPEYQIVDNLTEAKLEQRLTPIYPSTEGLTQNRIRNLCTQALEHLCPTGISELIKDNISSEFSLFDALIFVHSPPVGASLDLLGKGTHPAQQRLAFEELIAHHLSLRKLRQQAQLRPAPKLPFNKNAHLQFSSHLIFSLTEAQVRVSQAICANLNSTTPMLRLIQGDVGSGKTVVAALAAVQAIANGHQVALMAPTEILSEQHRLNFENWMSPLEIHVALLTGNIKGKARKKVLESIANGESQMVIGTHALFQEGVIFQKLGLTIVDEQHRFGVHQRLALRKKGGIGNHSTGTDAIMPHQLIMTATPIPRTLAMTAYADLDCSVIDELPSGRKLVETSVISNLRRHDVIQRVKKACQEGRQAYWVCTLIEESNMFEAEAAEGIAKELRLLLPKLSVGLIHGRLKPREKISIMEEFKSKKINLLVATTVIEVGVDVTNASLMIIENAERLGLSQLHQLRGRVGRGSDQSHCVLLYNSNLSQNSKERLKIMRETSDGFEIAEKDLELRGPGEVLGARQTGDVQFRIADLKRDANLIPHVKDVAQSILKNDPDAAQQIIDRWLSGNDQLANA